MERQGFDMPLLIGGATTSRVHTAVKIHPNYRRGQAVYVTDASRAVGVVSALLSPTNSAANTVDEVRAEYARIAAATPREEGKQRAVADRTPAPMRLSSTGRELRAAGAAAASARTRFADTTRSPNSSAISTGRRSSPPGN